MSNLQQLIEQAFENRADFSPSNAPSDVRQAVNDTAQLDLGTLRVAEKKDGVWVVNEWAKKAVLLSFRLNDNYAMPSCEHLQFFDKVPTKFATWSEDELKASAFAWYHLQLRAQAHSLVVVWC